MTDMPYAPTPRRRSKPPVTWPAFVLAALVGVAAALYYGLKVRPVRLYDEDLSYALWNAISPNLVPATVGALAIWSLLYFGFVRWKNGERGPLYFNLLFPIILGTLVALPFGQQAYDSWKAGDVKGMQVDLARTLAKAKAAEQAARAPLTAALTASRDDVRLEPESLVSATARRDAKARIATAREASQTYHDGYPARAASARVAYVQAIAGHKVAPEIAQATLARFDKDLSTQIARNEKILGWEQALFDEAEAGIAALNRAPWRPEGQRLLFASREAGVAFINHHQRAAELRFKLKQLTDGSTDVVILDAPAGMPPGKPMRYSDDYN